MTNVSSTPSMMQNELASGNMLQPGPIVHPGLYQFHSTMASPSFRPLHPLIQQPMTLQSVSNFTPSTSLSTTISLNRSQRCGICNGCKQKACGNCNYCQDSPQFGGPGVKKQSCIERRCLRVLENRLQRDAPTFKARLGCNNCEDCRMLDCQCCLVCLDKKFFANRYMPGALCAKKRCNNATNLDTPTLSSLDRLVGVFQAPLNSTPFQQPTKRSCDWTNFNYGTDPKKRSIEMPLGIFQPPPSSVPLNSVPVPFINKTSDPVDKQMHTLPSFVPQPMPASVPHTNLLMPVSSMQLMPPSQTTRTSSDFPAHLPSNANFPQIKESNPEFSTSHSCPTGELYSLSLPSISSLNGDSPFLITFSNETSEYIHNDERFENDEFRSVETNNLMLDPFVPPSYGKNAVVLQPL